MRRLLALVFVAAAHALALKTQGLGGGRLALLDFSSTRTSGTERPRPTNCSSAYLPRVIPKNSSLHRLDFKGLNQFFGEVTAMQLKRDRVRAHVWGRVTARYNAIAENCAGVWKL